MRDVVDLVSVGAELEIVGWVLRCAQRWQRAVDSAVAVNDLRENHLAGQDHTVEHLDRTPLEVIRTACFQLVGNELAIGARRVHEQLGVAIRDDRGDAEIEQRHQRRVDHQDDAHQPQAQRVDQSLHNTLMTRSLGLWATSFSHMNVTALGSAYRVSSTRLAVSASTGRSQPCRFTPLRICRSYADWDMATICCRKTGSSSASLRLRTGCNRLP